jgi:hypothetical protein
MPPCHRPHRRHNKKLCHSSPTSRAAPCLFALLTVEPDLPIDSGCFDPPVTSCGGFAGGSRVSCWGFAGAATTESPQTRAERPTPIPSALRALSPAFAGLRLVSQTTRYIGAPGFEPGTSPTRTARATRLRHAPTHRQYPTPSPLARARPACPAPDPRPPRPHPACRAGYRRSPCPRR